MIGCYYATGDDGFVQDDIKALELWHQSGELGYSPAYTNIGYAYSIGDGVGVDEKKAVHYYEQAAIGGNEVARNNLGCIEEDAGNTERALKHWMIAVKSGCNNSLKGIQDLYTEGNATKEDYTAALHAYQAYLNEIKSAQREASVISDDYKYY